MGIQITKSTKALKSTIGLRGNDGRLDLRGNGGYVVVPPSRHKTGNCYTAINEAPLAELPPAWIEAIANRQSAGVRRTQESSRTGDLSYLVGADARLRLALPLPPCPCLAELCITEGQRNNELTRIAGILRRQGVSEEALVESLTAINKCHCEPALEDEEVRRIAASVGRYAPQRPDE